MGGTAPVKAATFTANGREVLTTGAEPAARRWDARTGELLGEVRLPMGMADRMALVRFQSPELLVADSAFGGAEFNLRTRKARLLERSPFGEVAWEAFRSGDGWAVEFWAADAEARRLSQGRIELRLGRVGEAGRRTLVAFEADRAAASFDRGRVLLAYDDREGARRTLMCFRVTDTRSRRAWVRHLPVGPEFTDTYEDRRRADSSKVGSVLPEFAVLWAPDGATVLVVPGREQVPFLIDPGTRWGCGRRPFAGRTRFTRPGRSSRPPRPAATARPGGLADRRAALGAHGAVLPARPGVVTRRHPTGRVRPGRNRVGVRPRRAGIDPLSVAPEPSYRDPAGRDGPPCSSARVPGATDGAEPSGKWRGRVPVCQKNPPWAFTGVSVSPRLVPILSGRPWVSMRAADDPMALAHGRPP